MENSSGYSITKESFDAVLFDLDGVLTDTAKVHSTCWKKMFDEFLKEYTRKNDQKFRPFDIDVDYKQYIDGKLRYVGVQSFLESRKIELPHGEETAPPSYDSVCGLGNVKNAMVKEFLATERVEVFEGSVRFIDYLRKEGIKTAIVSASKNCQAVIQSGNIEHLFDVRVDGTVAGKYGLAGKPAPDTFVKAAEFLGVEVDRAVVVEDAISGIKAGRKGKFGLVVGIAHEGNYQQLKDSGADIVVDSLSELIP